MAKEIINVTDITAYLYCPRKVYLKLVKGIKEPPNQKMILGFLKHKIFDLFNKNEQTIVSSIKENLSKEQIIDLYKQHLTNITLEVTKIYSNMIRSFGINPNELLEETLTFMEKEIKLRADSIKKTLSLGFLGKELWRNLKPKYLTEFEIISSNLGLKGRVDRIKFDEIIEPCELKTRENIYEEDKIQLAAYSLLLEEEFGKKITKGTIETKNKQEEIEITEQDKNKVLEVAEKIRKMKLGEEPILQSNFSKCKNCRQGKECFGI